MKLTVDVLTPQEEIYTGEADEVIIPTDKGQIGILPGHVTLLTQILPGELIVKNGNKTDAIAIMGGYAEINKNHVNILGDYAVRAENIEIAKVEQAKAKAEKMEKEHLSKEDMLRLETDLRRSILELKVAERRKKHN